MGKHNNQKEFVEIGNIKKEVTILEEEDNLVQSQTLMECQNRPIKPIGRDGFVVAKVPLVLAEFEIEINSKASIRFDQPAVELLRVKKNVFLTECRLLPAARKLFIKGFVRKNIEYAARSKDSKESNSIRHITAYLPFNCTTMVEYFIDPVVNTCVVKCNVEEPGADSKHRVDPELDRENSEWLNEEIFCEIVKSKVFEIYSEEEEELKEKANAKTIQELDERLVIILTLRLLQRQLINIYGAKPVEEKHSSYIEGNVYNSKFSVNKSQKRIIYCRKR